MEERLPKQNEEETNKRNVCLRCDKMAKVLKKEDITVKFAKTSGTIKRDIDDSFKAKQPESKPSSLHEGEEMVNKQEYTSHFRQILCKPDIYERKAKDQEWRSRSCFKLLQIDERFKIFEGVTRVVDLLASPGVWTQVLSRILFMGETVYINDKPCLFYNELELHQRLERQEEPVYEKNEDVVIVAVDCHGTPPYPYPGVIQVHGDITQYHTSELILSQFNGNKVNLVVNRKVFEHCELYCLDVVFEASHIVNILYVTCNILMQGGTLVTAILKETDNNLIESQLLSLFKEVDIFRPKSSKISAKEAFAVCRYYAPPEGFDPKLMGPFLDFFNKDYSSLTGINRILIPFLICGDISAYPLSPEDEEMYKNKFTMPFTIGMPFSSRATLSDDLDQYLEKMDDAIKSIGMESDPDLVEIKMVKNKYTADPLSMEKGIPSSPGISDATREEEETIYDDGPLFDLIKKTTKIKKKYCQNEPELVPVECGFQFLFGNESTDPNQIKECLEYIQLKEIDYTCTCDDFT